MALDLCMNILESEAYSKSSKSPQQATKWRADKGTKHTPVISIKAAFEEEKVGASLSVSKIDSPKDKYSDDPAKAANYDFKASPPVKSVRETEAKNWDCGAGEEVGDEINLQDVRGFERQYNDWDDHSHDSASDPPDVELVAEEVV